MMIIPEAPNEAHYCDSQTFFVLDRICVFLLLIVATPACLTIRSQPTPKLPSEKEQGRTMNKITDKDHDSTTNSNNRYTEFFVRRSFS